MRTTTGSYPAHQLVYLLSVSPSDNEGGGSYLPAPLMLLWLGASYVLREVCSLTARGLGRYSQRMALSRGMMLGLAGGLAPSDPFRLSRVGEAWTVILCSKPAKRKRLS